MEWKYVESHLGGGGGESGEIKTMSYDWFFKRSVCYIVEVGINLSKRLKRRKKILEGDGVT